MQFSGPQPESQRGKKLAADTGGFILDANGQQYVAAAESVAFGYAGDFSPIVVCASEVTGGVTSFEPGESMMDEHRPTSTKPSTSRGGSLEKTKDAAGELATHATNAAGEVIGHAKVAAEGVFDHAKDAVGEVLTSVAEDVADQAPELARQARDQAGTLADDLYRSAGEYASRGVTTYPLTSLVIAAAVGYGLGYLSRRRS